MEIIKRMEQTEKKVKDLKIETDKLAKELKAK